MTPAARAAVFVLIGLVASVSAPSGQAAKPERQAVEMHGDPGRGRFLLRRPGGPMLVPAHDVAGYRQRVRIRPDGWTEVTVVVTPVLARPPAPYPCPAREDATLDAFAGQPADQPAPIRHLAEELVHGQDDQVAASAAILQWVTLNIEHRDIPPHDDSALATLQSGIGSCVGRSELAVALLRAAGMPARTIHGLLVTPTAARGAAAFQLHRFVETWIDGLGWVPSDPGESVHLVDPAHVVLALGGAPYDPDSQRGLEVTMAEPLQPLAYASDVDAGARPLLVRHWAPWRVDRGVVSWR